MTTQRGAWSERFGKTLRAPGLRKRVLPLVLLLLIAGTVFSAPLFGSAYIQRFLAEVFMFTALAYAWNLIGGLAGYVSFGHVAFFGIGAYTVAYMTANQLMPLLPAVLLAGLLAAAFAALIGVPILRLRGHYFAIATLGVAEALRQIASVTNEITGGGVGMLVPSPEGSTDERTRLFYFAFLGVAVLSVLLTAFVMRHRLGFGLRAIRASEEAAASLGVGTTTVKVTAFILSGAIGGICGGLFAPWTIYLDPPTAFNLELSVLPVVLTLVGGIGTLWGPMLGAIVVLITGELLWGSFLELHSAFLGAVLVLTVLLLPRGIISLGATTRDWWHRAMPWLRRPLGGGTS